MSPPHRFFISAGAIEGDRAVLRDGQARQIAAVLRLAPGDHVILVEHGDDVRVRLDEVSSRAVRASVLCRRRNAAEPRVRLALGLPLLRGRRDEEVVEAVTQLGVSRIVPFTSERSVVRDLPPARRARWERIAREAAETARRGRVPEIGPLVPWDALFDALDHTLIVAWEGEGERPLTGAVRGTTSAISLVVGPEGGLTDGEVALAHQSGAVTVSLGPRNLRSETAAISAVAQIVGEIDAPQR